MLVQSRSSAAIETRKEERRPAASRSRCNSILSERRTKYIVLERLSRRLHKYYISVSLFPSFFPFFLLSAAHVSSRRIGSPLVIRSAFTMDRPRWTKGLRTAANWVGKFLESWRVKRCLKYLCVFFFSFFFRWEEIKPFKDQKRWNNAFIMDRKLNR